MTIPAGAGVREALTGKLGRVVRVSRLHKRRGSLSVLFDGEGGWRHVPFRNLVYVARHYAAARAWAMAAPIVQV
jgi:hypothetical protein